MLRKTCIKCVSSLPVSDFYKDRSRQDGLDPRCKQCKNGERKAAGYDKIFYERHRVARIAAVRARDARTGDSPARAKAWREANPERQKMHARLARRRRRAALKGAGIYLVTHRDLDRLMRRHDGCCAYCPAPATEFDHVVPISRGGHHSIGNLLPVCGTCNRSKNCRLLTEWRPMLTKRMAA